LNKVQNSRHFYIFPCLFQVFPDYFKILWLFQVFQTCGNPGYVLLMCSTKHLDEFTMISYDWFLNLDLEKNQSYQESLRFHWAELFSERSHIINCNTITIIQCDWTIFNLQSLISISNLQSPMRSLILALDAVNVLVWKNAFLCQ